MNTIVFNRKQLYELVWAKSLAAIANEYRISYAELRKACEDMNIPIPPNGHWSKIQFGKPVHKMGMPLDYVGNDEITINIVDELNTFSKDKVKEIRSDKKLTSRVPSKLKNPDKLITAAQENLKLKKHPLGVSYELIGTESRYLRIRVAPKNIDRALRFMNTLIKLLRAEGHDIIVKQEDTYAVVFGEEISICLQEKLRIEETIDKYGWRSRKYFSTDILTFRAYMHHKIWQRIWGDGNLIVENQLPQILVLLESWAKREKEERAEREKLWKIQEEKNRIEQEAKQRVENEGKAFKELFSQATRLHQANILRNYIKAIEEKAIENSNLTEELKNWIEWAKKKVEWYDPLINGDDPWLSDYYRTNLFKSFILEWQ